MDAHTCTWHDLTSSGFEEKSGSVSAKSSSKTGAKINSPVVISSMSLHGINAVLDDFTTCTTNTAQVILPFFSLLDRHLSCRAACSQNCHGLSASALSNTPTFSHATHHMKPPNGSIFVMRPKMTAAVPTVPPYSTNSCSRRRSSKLDMLGNML
eukprot:357338-Chlamydomonas_euryale.AAC.2